MKLNNSSHLIFKQIGEHLPANETEQNIIHHI